MTSSKKPSKYEYNFVCHCTLEAGKLYKQDSRQKEKFVVLNKLRADEQWVKNKSGLIIWPSLDKVYLFVGRTKSKEERGLLFDMVGYTFLCGEDLFVFSAWDDNIEDFEKIWQKVG